MSWKTSVESLKRFAAAPWFPVLVGCLSGVNVFTLVLTGPLVVLFFSALLANPRRWFLIALANAVGSVAGYAMLLLLINMRGTDFVKDAFPSAFSSTWWKWTEGTMEAYGPLAATPVSFLPIILHPLIVFAKLSNMSDAALLASIFAGRTIKYVVMSQMALAAPPLLRFFGTSQEVISKIQSKEH